MICNKIKPLDKDSMEAITEVFLLVFLCICFALVVTPIVDTDMWFSKRTGLIYLWGFIDKIFVGAVVFGLFIGIVAFISWTLIRYFRTIFCPQNEGPVLQEKD